MSALQDFLAFVAPFLFLGSAIDFFIGKEGQRRVKEFVLSWKDAIAKVRLKTFARDEARLAHRLLYGLFGKLFSRRRLQAIGTITIAASALSAYFTWLDYPQLNMSFLDISWSFLIASFVQFINAILALWLSLSFTTWLALYVCERLGTGVLYNLTTYFILCVLQLSVIFLTPALAATPSMYILDALDLPYSFGAIHTMGRLGVWAPLADSYPEPLLYVFTNMLVEFYAMIPGLLRLVIAITFLMSWVFPLVHATSVLILTRLIEHDKPVFTTVFTGLAVVVKCFEELAKWSAGLK